MTRTADDFRELARLNHSGTHSCAGACLAEVIAAFEREAASPAALDVERRFLLDAAGHLAKHGCNVYHPSGWCRWQRARFTEQEERPGRVALRPLEPADPIVVEAASPAALHEHDWTVGSDGNPSCITPGHAGAASPAALDEERLRLAMERAINNTDDLEAIAAEYARLTEQVRDEPTTHTSECELAMYRGPRVCICGGTGRSGLHSPASPDLPSQASDSARLSPSEDQK